MRLVGETTVRAGAIVFFSYLTMLCAWADEPAAEFLDALRGQGYYDVALEYLDTIENDPLVDIKFRQTIPYQRAKTLIEEAATLPERTAVEQRLDRAQELLAEYAQQDSSLVQKVRTLDFRGRILSRRADLFLEDANADHLTAEEREQNFVEARSYLEDSLESVTTATQAAEKLLDPRAGNSDALKIDRENPESRKLVREIRAAYQALLVQRPYTVERIADTFSPQIPERRRLLADAAEVQNRIWNQYPSSIAGVRACVFSGRCYQKNNQHDQALRQFSQVMSLDRKPQIYRLQKLAFALATDSWQASSPYPIRSVIGQLEPVVENLTRTQKQDPDWLRVTLELGIAKKKLAEATLKEGDANASSRSKAIDRQAARLVRDVTRSNNPYRQRARKLLEAWAIPLISADATETTKKIETFTDAFQAGREAVGEIELLFLESAEARRSAQNGPASAVEKTQSLNQRLLRKTDAAITIFDQAIDLADDSTSRDDINLCRYFQCYSYFASRRFLEASIIGQYVLDRYPTKNGSKRASGLLLDSRSALFAAADKADNEYEKRALRNTALAVAGRWPGSGEAGKAVQILVRSAVRDGRLRDAMEYMDKLPSGGSARANTAGLLGQKLYTAYLTAAKDPETARNKIELDSKLNQAFEFLKLSESLVRPGSVQFADAVTGLMLIEASLKKGNVQEALTRLESSVVSPLKLIKDRSPVVFADPRGNKLKRDAYRTIVKTYIAKMQSADLPRLWIDKATGVINLLQNEAQASGSADDRSQLAAIYLLISIELKKRFDQLDNPADQLKFSKVLAMFLGAIVDSSDRGRVVLVSATTMLQVADQLSVGGLASEARPLFRQAVAALDRAEKLGFKNAADHKSLELKLKRQRALARRGEGNYEQSVQQFIEILKESNSFSIQIDAASTLQQWGRVAKLQKPFVQAVKGTGAYPDPKTNQTKNAIWGWQRILSAARSDKTKLREQYYLASFSIAEAIYRQAVILKKSNGKKSALEFIKRERARDPDFLGSEKWKKKFAELEQEIRGS